MKSKTSSNGGYWMLLGLVVLLGVPPVVGHYLMVPEAKPSVHAEATAD